MPAATSDRRVRLVAMLVVGQLTASVLTAIALQPDRTPAPLERVAAQVPQAAQRAAPSPAQERRSAIDALLARRAAAVLTRDRDAFLATVDGLAVPFRERQAALFDALADVPLTAWGYTVRTDELQPPDPLLDARYGTWWAPRVVLAHGLRDIDDVPAESTQHLTFVLRPQGWVIAADDDFDARGDRTARALWDGGPVVAVLGERSLVLSHPDATEAARRTAQEVDEAVVRVAAAVGQEVAGRVAVLVPADQAELARLVDTGGSLSPIAALAVSGPVRGGSARGGDRVLVNPPNLARLGALGRRVVLTHEVTHVATRPQAGPLVPVWLAEGLADHVGYLGTGVQVELAAAELRSDVRAGRLPTRLPLDADFGGDQPDLPQAYEQAWLAVELLVERYGLERVLALHAALGARTQGPADVALDEALQRELGTTTAALTRDWSAFLVERLR